VPDWLSVGLQLVALDDIGRHGGAVFVLEAPVVVRPHLGFFFERLWLLAASLGLLDRLRVRGIARVAPELLEREVMQRVSWAIDVDAPSDSSRCASSRFLLPAGFRANRVPARTVGPPQENPLGADLDGERRLRG
jgi:hypothetical protein